MKGAPGRRALPVTWLIWGGITLVCAGLVASVAWFALQSRDKTLAAAQGSVQNIALVLEQQTIGTLNAINLFLKLTADTRQRLGEEGAEELSSIVAEAGRTLPYLEGLKILDAESNEVLYRSQSLVTVTDELDWDVYLAHLGDPYLSFSISRPYRNEQTGSWLVGISRRVERGPGRNAMLTLAYLDLGHLQRFYEGIAVGQAGTIALLRSDAVLLARKPYNTNNVGRRFPNSGILKPEWRFQPHGTYTSVSAMDGLERIVAFRRLTHAPLVISATLSIDEALADWRRETAQSGSVALVVLLLLVGFGVLVTREAHRRSRAEAQALAKSAVLEATLENMDQGLVLIDAEGRVPVCNERALTLLGHPAPLLEPNPLFSEVLRWQFAQNEFAKSDEAFQAYVRQGGLRLVREVYERQRPNGTVLEIRTVPLLGGGAVRTYTDITARREAERKIAHMARHDALTDLPNRVLFREHMEEALGRVRRTNEQIAVLCLDLDNFKAVNDTLGHPMGDALLRAVADRIRTVLRDGDEVARFGGDEFAVLQRAVERPEDAGVLARRLVDVIGRPYLLDGQQINVGVSLGIAVAPADGQDPDHLLKSADMALYRAKADGRATFRFFEPDMDARVQARRALEIDLRHALARGEFLLNYQPLVSLKDGHITGFEALVRWQHPVRGLVSPADFIPIAEETGLITRLGTWVLRQACADAASWPAGIKVAVNLSPLQFRDPALLQTVVSALAASGLEPGRLELEITESVLMENSDKTVRVLHQLRRLGLQISLDDFGTGYSSLSYLRSFPFDKIKIDRSFVKEIASNAESAAIVRAIAGLAASLGMVTTAEGVETIEQLEAVRAAGCTQAQGFLLSPPRPDGDVPGLFAAGPLVRAA